MSERPRTTALGLLSAGLGRLRARPEVAAWFLLAGAAVTGVDLLRAESPVAVGSGASSAESSVRLEFWILVTIVRGTGFVPGTLLGLRPEWLLVTVGLELFSLAVIVAAAYGGLCALLGAEPSTGAALRYGGLLVVLATAVPEVTFEGGSVVFGFVVLVLFLYVLVRLVPVPGRLAYGESVRTAFQRSWAQSHGHAWSLFGVVLVLGLANYLLSSLPLVGPLGSSVVAALHAAAVAVFLDRTGRRARGTATDTRDPSSAVGTPE